MSLNVYIVAAREVAAFGAGTEDGLHAGKLSSKTSGGSSLGCAGYGLLLRSQLCRRLAGGIALGKPPRSYPT